MAENRREKGRRFYFTKAQLALLAGAFTVTATGVFVLGVFVGKEIEARKVVRPEEPLVKVPVRPAAKRTADAENAKNNDLTFYNTLTKNPAAKPAEEKPAEKVTEVTNKPVADAQARGASTLQQPESADAKATARPGLFR